MTAKSHRIPDVVIRRLPFTFAISNNCNITMWIPCPLSKWAMI